MVLQGSVTNRAVPVILFGVMALSGAAMTLLLPETLNTQLPDTVKQAEHLQQASLAPAVASVVVCASESPDQQDPGKAQHIHLLPRQTNEEAKMV